MREECFKTYFIPRFSFLTPSRGTVCSDFPMANLFECVVSGTGSRWMVGTLILTHLIAYNEAGGPGLMIGMALAALYAALAGK